MTKSKKPLLTVILIYSICYLFRFTEYFLIQTDRTFWGEAFLHKVMGIVILCMIVRFFSLRLYISSYTMEGNTGNQTGLLFFAICIIGNVINVIMEEGVFRGLFQKLLEQKYKFIASAVLISMLFGVWHVIAPIRQFYEGGSMGGIMVLAVPKNADLRLLSNNKK